MVGSGARRTGLQTRVPPPTSLQRCTHSILATCCWRDAARVDLGRRFRRVGAESLGDELHITLVDQNDAFIFGFSKLEILFGRQTREEVRYLYRDISRPGVEFRQERVTSIDPQTRHVVSDEGTYEPDILVVALGADYDPAATPGFVEDGYEYYSVAGAERLGEVLSTDRLQLPVSGAASHSLPSHRCGAELSVDQPPAVLVDDRLRPGTGLAFSANARARTGWRADRSMRSLHQVRIKSRPSV